ncbi:MAG TPA: FtsW/RodA/SpoVE family cell cycle protein, partial [Polyangia bacterium]|nr:FtsW/RodA/SpoVE family cell cycle protein [Polyangia bacterium]
MMQTRGVGWRRLRFRFDWTLTLAAAAVATLGLINLWSAVHDRQSNLFSQQISWLGLGVAVFLGVATLDYRTISRYAYLLHGVGVALLLGVLLFGKMVGGGRRWFDLGPFHVQPSELMQLLTAIALGKYLND